jgi:RNA recognition motif-containing protein
MYHKVVDDPDLVRDSRSQGIINTNNDDLIKYKQKRNKELLLNNIIKEHETIKSELTDIKNMLLQLLGNKS